MIGEDIIGLFAVLGDAGMLLAMAVIILVDGVGFPTLPEVWMVFIFGAHPDSFAWGAFLVLVCTLASLGGNLTLYSFVKLVKVPHRVERIMQRYLNFIIVHDERVLLLNRAAPILPYTGAFIAVSNWNLKKCALYLFIGAMAKSSLVVIIAWLSFDNLRAEVAPWVSLGLVLTVLLISLIVSFIYKKRAGLRGVPERSQ
jgi:membrane protein DedA with SNARE-associated domain